jgi:hypothetical protein
MLGDEEAQTGSFDPVLHGIAPPEELAEHVGLLGKGNSNSGVVDL